MLLRHTRPDDLDGVLGVEEGAGAAQWFSATGRGPHEAALADPDQLHLLFARQHHPENGNGVTEEFIGYAVLAGCSKPGPMEMRRMAISPMQRGKGYGRQFLAELLKLITEEMQDRELVWVGLRPDNEPARALFESLGFEPGDPPPGVEPVPELSYLNCEL